MTALILALVLAFVVFPSSLGRAIWAPTSGSASAWGVVAVVAVIAALVLFLAAGLQGVGR